MTARFQIKGKTLSQVRPGTWRLEPLGKMRVGVELVGSQQMLATLNEDKSLEQAMNVASLPGVLDPVVTLPDIHQGYGFPIGGVAAFHPRTGVVSPGGVGYDINCGVRLLRTPMERAQLQRPKVLKELAAKLFQRVPCGVGSKRSDLRLSSSDLDEILSEGIGWAIRNGYASNEDRLHTEEQGQIQGANPDHLSERSKERGSYQLGTLGSGNHFLEVQYVESIYDPDAARCFGLTENQVVLTIHTGSRGLGYQVCSDYLEESFETAKREGIELPDRELAAAPLTSSTGKNYLSAMAGAANFAFVNRQIITHWVRRVFQENFEAKDINLIYDVCHNIAKFEEIQRPGGMTRVCIHRKGATRAYPANHPGTPPAYREVGQPILVPGDMGRCSYVLAGGPNALAYTWGSSCHGAGRLLSRSQAKKRGRGRSIGKELESQGIIVRAAGQTTLLEEMPEAYKDVSEVVHACEVANLCRRVAKLRPIVVVKG